MSFIIPKLPYNFNTLEPYIDSETMRLHYTKHHAGYVEKLNLALEKYPEYQSTRIDTLMKSLNSLPEEIQRAVRNNGGGYYNHSLFWDILTPSGKKLNNGPLKDALEKEFQTFKNFTEKFSTAASTLFGSGWAWLYLQKDNTVAIGTTPNQDNPLMDGISEIKGTPILALDVWEHAYYLKYQNKRPEYIKAWWNVINWQNVEERYLSALQKK